MCVYVCRYVRTYVARMRACVRVLVCAVSVCNYNYPRI